MHVAPSGGCWPHFRFRVDGVLAVRLRHGADGDTPGLLLVGQSSLTSTRVRVSNTAIARMRPIVAARPRLACAAEQMHLSRGVQQKHGSRE